MSKKRNNPFVSEGILFIEHLCNTYGPRISCTKDEIDASEDLAKKLKEDCDDVYLDSFPVYPDLYPGGFIKITAAFIFFGLIFMFFRNPYPILSTIFILVGFFQLFITYVKMNEFFGFLFKKGTSYNATGRIYPRNEQGEVVDAKKRVVIAGHIDSAYQMPITKHGDNVYKAAAPGFFYIIVQFLFGIIKPLYLVFGDPKVYYENNLLYITIIDFIFIGFAVIGIPSLIYLIKGLVGGIPVEGANDNLSGVGIALALGKYFTKKENRLKNVELWVGGFGSEECGERGAQAFVVKYGKQGLLDDSYNIIPESCGAGDRIGIITKEAIHLAHHDLELCENLFQGYQDFIHINAIDDPIPCKVQKLPFSASDAGRFSLAGYSASMIIAFEGKLAKPRNWHHELDVPENLERNMMETVFGIYKHYILNLEKELQHFKK